MAKFGNGTPRMDRAGALPKKGRSRAALKALRFVVASDPRDLNALFRLALASHKAGQFRRALRYWTRLRDISPAYGNLNLNMGCAYEKLGQRSLAIRHYRKELAFNQLCVEALYNLGNLYYEMHNYRGAADFLERCYAMRHSAEEIFERLAHCYFKTRHLEKEVRLYQDRLRGHPSDTWSLRNLAAALVDMGEYSRAQMLLQKLTRINPGDQAALRDLKAVESIRRNAPRSGDQSRR